MELNHFICILKFNSVGRSANPAFTGSLDNAVPVNDQDETETGIN